MRPLPPGVQVYSPYEVSPFRRRLNHCRSGSAVLSGVRFTPRRNPDGPGLHRSRLVARRCPRKAGVRKRAGPVLLRMTADVLLASAALAAGFALTFGMLVGAQHPPPAGLWRNLAAQYGLQPPLLAALVMGSNALSGLYYRTRFYTRRSKILALARSISLAYASLVSLLFIASPPAGGIPWAALTTAAAVLRAMDMPPIHPPGLSFSGFRSTRCRKNSET